MPTATSSGLTQEQKVQLLTKDFLERDENDRFVRIRRTGRLGWESTLPEQGTYSSFFLNPKSKEDLIKSAYGVACDMLTVMDTPFKIKVNISKEQSCTDGRTVNVATKVFDDADLPLGQKADTFVGLAIHEGCHLLYTDLAAPRGCGNDTVMALQNIIEDERIERVCSESKPGLANFLKASKYYYFDKYRRDMERNGRMRGLTDLQRLMNAIISFVRYPAALSADDAAEFADTLLGVKDILSDWPESTADAVRAAHAIYELMRRYAEQQQPQGSSGSGEAQDDGGETGNGSGTASGSGDAQDAQAAVDEAVSAMGGALSMLSGEPGGTLGENDMSEAVTQDGCRAGRVCEGTLERGLQKGAYIEKGVGNREAYEEALQKVKPYVAAVRRAVTAQATDYRFNLHGMRSGRLDTGKIVEAVQGVPTVYVREGEVKAGQVAVCILIDESGSMWGAGEQAAREAAVLLNEALGGIPNIDLYIYGHTASRSVTSLYVYRERGQKNPDRFAVGGTDSRAGNHDSVAIREACARVRRHTREKCLFFMISDGAPNEGAEVVRKAVQDVEKDGFSVVAISIDPYYDPSTMYSKNVNLTDLATLAPDLGKLVRKAVLEKTSRQVRL